MWSQEAIDLHFFLLERSTRDDLTQYVSYAYSNNKREALSMLLQNFKVTVDW